MPGGNILPSRVMSIASFISSGADVLVALVEVAIVWLATLRLTTFAGGSPRAITQNTGIIVP